MNPLIDCELLAAAAVKQRPTLRTSHTNKSLTQEN
jgi:hypothetical protein